MINYYENGEKYKYKLRFNKSKKVGVDDIKSISDEIDEINITLKDQYDSNNNNSYGSFWQTEFIDININEAIPFNNSGICSSDISLINDNTIKINNGGVYYVSYVISIKDASGNEPIFQARISLYINGEVIENTMTSFGMLNKRDLECTQLTGYSMISIPQNSEIQLRSDLPNGETLSTCNNNLNSFMLNIFKIVD